ncbi:MAG: exodeoxyribonuclease VII small subunit [Leptospiraceae bacterium]|nr:exodeoxyribonuclease VII small subunit [Leptospiraceae bacterium]
MAKKRDISFEEALEELEEITRNLEGGQLSLDDSIKAYEKGMELKKLCSSILESAEKKLEYIKKQEDGSLATEPIEEDQDALF